MNVRGAVFMLIDRVDPYSILNAWQRAGFSTPSTLTGINKTNAHSYTREKIYSAFAQKSVDWTNPDHCTRALKAMSTIVRKANSTIYGFDDEFTNEYDELIRACKDDGFILEDDGTISQSPGVDLDDLDLSEIEEAEGVMRTIKRLNRAITSDHDPSDVVGYAKNLVEAVAAAILARHGFRDEDVRRMRLHERTSAVQKTLDIADPQTDVGSIITGLEGVIKGLNKTVAGIAQMRREKTDAGHANHTAPVVDSAQANLAVDAALAWCRFALNSSKENLNAPPF